MMKPLKFLLLFFILGHSTQLIGQFTDRYWTFGEHAAINFSNLANPVPDTSKLNTRGTCASICDSLGNLLFYAASPDDSVVQLPNQFQQGYVLNKLHSRMGNSDSLKTTQWYQEMIIVPDPGNSQRFYLFHSGITTTTNPGFYYSVIDLSYNNGLGAVVQKNIRLESFPVCDGLAVTKHGNGRDWWVVIKNWSTTTSLDEFYVYLVSPAGITPQPVQHIGTAYVNGNIARFKFNIEGSRLYAIQFANLIERYDFDRCTGLLSNSFTITPRLLTNPGDRRWSLAISPDETKLYITSIYNGSNSDSSFLFQYDLSASNIAASVDTLSTIVRNGYSRPVAGLLQLGPDNKIYFSTASEVSDCGWQWLYCDTSSFFTENMNLGVINLPDSLGAACDFQPYSFYLGGHRTYIGVPNNPNYELGKLVGSPCDTLGSVGINELSNNGSKLMVYYDIDWQKAFINAKGLAGKQYRLTVYDIAGKIITSLSGTLHDEFFYYGMSMESLSSGVYLISLETEKERLVKRVVKSN